MPSYKNKENGAIIFLEDGSKLISIWERLETPQLRVPDDGGAPQELAPSNSQDEMQTFETVVELKKSADKSLPARTVRGAVYEYSDGEWRKVSG
jgi:hypothetical protein